VNATAARSATGRIDMRFDGSAAERRLLHYPKTDTPLADDVLRGLADERRTVGARRAEILREHAASLFGDPKVEVTTLDGVGTFHVLHRVTPAADPAHPVIVRSSLDAVYRRDPALHLDGWLAGVLDPRAVPLVTTVKADTSRTVVPFDYAISEMARGGPLDPWSATPERRRTLFAQLGGVLRVVHASPAEGAGLVDLEPFIDPPHRPTAIRGVLDAWTDYVLLGLDEHVARCRDIDAITASEVGRLERLFETLAPTLAATPKRLLHGDPGGHNVFVDGEGITAILDWEDALVGDPVFDLAWWGTFHRPEFLDELLAGYGAEVLADDATRFRYHAYFVRIALSKTVHRHRFGMPDAADRPPPSRRIQWGLQMAEAS
jgi:aminoglycoside phosphotransferase (APT) family kinase protein